MRYLVDGSNVLGAQGLLGRSGAALRLLWAVERYCASTRSTALVVFDGMDGRIAGEEFSCGVRIRCRIAALTGPSDRADRELLAEIGDRASPVTLVTSDAALASAAMSRGARIIRSEAFARRMAARANESLSEKDAAESGVDNAELLRLWTAGDD